VFTIAARVTYNLASRQKLSCSMIVAGHGSKFIIHVELLNYP
jgi:hypothetical protein